jgi:aminopeptidase-like protein
MVDGKQVYDLAKKLWNFNRSLTGDGVRLTLKNLRTICNLLKIKEVPSASKVFDWTIPQEWKVKSAYILSPNGKKILDFSKNNLHLVGYSCPVNGVFTLDELNKKLFSLPKQPDAIPYVTSYYKKDWGFCLSHNQRKKLKRGKYKVVIDSKLFKGSLSYGEICIKGKLNKEIFLSTYVCHPSMANNELSGPVVAIYLADWLKLQKKKLKYSYRIIFVPETIGSLTYLSQNLKVMKEKIVAGYNISCVGDDRTYSFLPSRNGNTISDNIAKHILKWTYKKFKKYSWNDRGSDERQYCAPGIDLPIASVMRSKYGEYPEYHTSLDNLQKVVSPSGLQGSFEVYKKIITALENNCFPKATVLGEPHLSKRGLYSTLSNKSKETIDNERFLLNLLTYSDGQTSLLDIAEKCSAPIWKFYDLVKYLEKMKLLKLKEKKN